MAEKRRRGLPLDPSIQRIIDSLVEPFPHLRFDVDAFWYLSRLRPFYFGGMGYIPEAEILAYAQLRGLTLGTEQLDDLIRNIRTMDEEYLIIQKEKQEETDKNKDGKKNG